MVLRWRNLSRVRKQAALAFYHWYSPLFTGFCHCIYQTCDEWMVLCPQILFHMYWTWYVCFTIHGGVCDMLAISTLAKLNYLIFHPFHLLLNHLLTFSNSSTFLNPNRLFLPHRHLSPQLLYPAPIFVNPLSFSPSFPTTSSQETKNL